ncbi:MAG: hypothetical protein KAT77_01525 [Nanoarchaeota archaeon]|nr:hypothetical protein [Nanoarchaeota archaeon]
MSMVGVILAINLYVLFMALFHKMFEDKHGGVKAIIFSNLVILAVVVFGFVLFY